jgi:precorrin-2/cobalt-factor-2 C20-methyltransferase
MTPRQPYWLTSSTAAMTLRCSVRAMRYFTAAFVYLFARLARRYRIEIVPGMPSITACAAAA